MHCYALRAKLLAIERNLQHVGVVTATRIPQSGNFVDVYA